MLLHQGLGFLLRFEISADSDIYRIQYIGFLGALYMIYRIILVQCCRYFLYFQYGTPNIFGFNSVNNLSIPILMPIFETLVSIINKISKI